jgi:hypothetical protein
MDCIDNQYVPLEIQENQAFVTEMDDCPIREASSSSYDFTEGDVNSPYIVPSSLR